MNKHEILEKNLGDEIIVLTKEAGRDSRNKQEIRLRIAECLRQMFGKLRLPQKNNPDPNS